MSCCGCCGGQDSDQVNEQGQDIEQEQETNQAQETEQE